MKLTIVTITYNNLAGLCKTVDSVLSQTINDFEYIVIDGASTDGTQTYLSEIRQIWHRKQENLFIISEPDLGIYNAMNKGIRLAHGEYILFLNSGDHFFDKFVVEQFDKDMQTADIYACRVIEEQSEKIITYSREKVTLWGLFHGSIPHQGTFIKRVLFQQIGMYSEDLKILSDFEFLLKAVLANVSFCHNDAIIAYVEPGGVSNTQIQQMQKEQQIIFERVLPQYVQDDLVQIHSDIAQYNETIVWFHKSKWLYDWYCKCQHLFCKIKGIGRK